MWKFDPLSSKIFPLISLSRKLLPADSAIEMTEATEELSGASRQLQYGPTVDQFDTVDEHRDIFF